jgi:hypothetical protein
MGTYAIAGSASGMGREAAFGQLIAPFNAHQ